MEQLQQKVNELEQRIQQLEKGNLITDEFVYNLVRRGFIKSNYLLEFSGGVGGNPFTNLVFNAENGSEYMLGIVPTGTLIEFTATPGSKNLTVVGGYNPLQGYTGSVTVFSTGEAPNPLYSGGVFFVTSATSSSFQLDNLTMTNRGTGRHFVQLM